MCFYLLIADLLNTIIIWKFIEVVQFKGHLITQQRHIIMKKLQKQMKQLQNLVKTQETEKQQLKTELGQEHASRTKRRTKAKK